MRILFVLALALSNGVVAQTSGLGSVVDVKVAFSNCAAAVGNGVADDSGAFQCHANYLSNAGNGFSGGIVHVPTGTYYFGSTVTIPQAVTLEGVGEGSVISQKHTFKGIMVKLRKASRLRHMKFTQEQPAAGPNWTPYMDYDFQIAVSEERVNVEDVMLLSPTNGIRLQTDIFPNDPGGALGQIYISNIRGQPLYQGIVIDGVLDIIRINDIHFWPFWSVQSDVINYIKANSYGVRSYRDDNPFFSQIFTFGYYVGIEFGASPAGSHPPVTGITSRPRINGFDCDGCGYGILVTGDGTNGIMANKLQVLGSDPSGPAIAIYADHVSASITQLDSTWSSVNVVRIDGDYNSILIGDSIVRTWNRVWLVNGLTFPAFEIASGPNTVLQISNTLYGDGYGALPARAVQGTLITNGLTHALGVIQ